VVLEEDAVAVKKDFSADDDARVGAGAVMTVVEVAVAIAVTADGSTAPVGATMTVKPPDATQVFPGLLQASPPTSVRKQVWLLEHQPPFEQQVSFIPIHWLWQRSGLSSRQVGTAGAMTLEPDAAVQVREGGQQEILPSTSVKQVPPFAQ
jgi:hypothetical protein